MAHKTVSRTSLRITPPTFSAITLGLFLGVAAFASSANGRTVRIGVYDNPPKVEMASSGVPRGIFIDIIGHIARRERWKVEYVYGTWEDGLRRLENDSIDLMPDVAFSEARNILYDFNQITILSSWLQVYSRKDVPIASVASLDGKTIAVLEGSIQQQVGERLENQFGLSIRQIAFPDYNATTAAVTSGVADAMIVSRFYAYSGNRESTLVSTPVILHPTNLHFAVAHGRNHDLLSSIDSRVAVLMNHPRSAYYQSLSRWLHEKPRMFVPGHIIGILVVIVAGLAFFFITSLLLKWQVSKRTRELFENNTALSAAMQKLKAAQDDYLRRERLYALGQLACGVAHDFNNLLTPIVGSTSLLLSDTKKLTDTEKVRVNLERISSAARHGAEIVQRLQRFYRTSKRSDTVGRVDVNALIRDVIELSRPRLNRVSSSGTPVEVTLTLCETCEVNGKRTDIHEMLLNLVLNAVDAMTEGGTLEISTERVGDSVKIIVKDTGEGMSEETREKCLQPFFSTKGEKGTGMGLTMVNNIIAEHGGRLHIASALGAGTSIIITFPYATELTAVPQQ